MRRYPLVTLVRVPPSVDTICPVCVLLSGSWYCALQVARLIWFFLDDCCDFVCFASATDAKWREAVFRKCGDGGSDATMHDSFAAVAANSSLAFRGGRPT